jgi:hypothetical protein
MIRRGGIFQGFGADAPPNPAWFLPCNNMCAVQFPKYQTDQTEMIGYQQCTQACAVTGPAADVTTECKAVQHRMGCGALQCSSASSGHADSGRGD